MPSHTRDTHSLVRFAVSALLAALLGSSAAAGQDNPAQPLPAIGTSGGTPFTRQCPAGQVLSGIRVRVGLVIDAVGIKCRPVNANGSLGGESNVGTLAGGTGGLLSEGSCGEQRVVSGQSGGAALGAGVALFELRCRAWDAAARRFTGGVTSVIHVIGGTSGVHLFLNAFPSSRYPADDCSRQNQPAVLLRGRSGVIVDAVALTCNEP